MISTSSETIGSWVGLTALCMAIPAAFLSFAPFTPAIVVTIVTFPLGITAIVLKAWRSGGLAVYWALTSILAFPNVSDTDLMTILLMVAYCVGVLATRCVYDSICAARPLSKLGVTGNEVNT